MLWRPGFLFFTGGQGTHILPLLGVHFSEHTLLQGSVLSNFIYLFFKHLLSLYVFLFGCAGLRCCMGFFLAVVSGVYSPVVVLRPLIMAASLVAEHRLLMCGFQSL